MATLGSMSPQSHSVEQTEHTAEQDPGNRSPVSVSNCTPGSLEDESIQFIMR